MFGLLIDSSRANFEHLDNQVHSFATRLILLDRTLAGYGPDAALARGKLIDYVQVAIEDPARIQADGTTRSDRAEKALTALGGAIMAIALSNPSRLFLLDVARTQYQAVVEERWNIVEASRRSWL